jgi:bifunctional DNA-binding transcriptional regulator/antitoxin component of YhaV-PrlF toxin-antitoxin module
MTKEVRNSNQPRVQIDRTSRRGSRRSTKVSAKHQVTIPASAFEGAGLAVGDRLKAEPVGAGKVLLERVESQVSSYSGVLTGVWDKDELESLRNEWD